MSGTSVARSNTKHQQPRWLQLGAALPARRGSGSLKGNSAIWLFSRYGGTCRDGARFDPGVYHAGLAAARARGRNGGRPAKISERQLEHAKRLLADRATTMTEVAASLSVDRSNLYRALDRARRTNHAHQRQNELSGHHRTLRQR